LFLNNPARIYLIEGFGEIFEFLGSICIALLTTLSCYTVITKTEYYKTRLNSPVVPTIMFLIMSYTVGKKFMSLYGTAADAIIVLFCMDEEIHKNLGKSGAQHCPQELEEFIREAEKHG